jgi:hypothetical protein
MTDRVSGEWAAGDTVYPARVVGTQIAHLATQEVDEAGGDLRAICPGRDTIAALELIPEGAVIVWCGGCRAWAAEAAVPLPRSR